MTRERYGFDTLASKWKEIQLPPVEVSPAVLEAIREPEGHISRTRHRGAARTGEGRRNASGRLVSSRPRKIGWMAVALFVLLTVSVSASVLPIRWEGGTFVIQDDGGRNARIDAWKERIFGVEPTYKQTIEEVLRTGENMEKTVTLEEAASEFPFPLLRPANGESGYLPVRSIGALMNEMMQAEGKAPELIGHRPVFHDFYDLPGGWAIVTQSLNESATKAAEGAGNSRTGTYVGNWEQVEWGGRALAMYIPSAKQNRLVIEYKTANGQVLDVEVTGTASKEDLVLLAEAYIGKRN